jgi:hypothetical protein
MLNSFNNAAGLPPTLRNNFTDPGLPAIRGKWHFVDPNGTYRTTGAFTNLYDAYNACVDERGDGIALVSSGNSTAETTSYMTYPLDWTKEGITMVGVCAPTRMYQRARIASKSITTGTIATLAFPTATTITDSAAGFVTAGFVVGQTIAITTTDGTNDGNAIITAVTAGTITCSASTFTIQTAATAGNSDLTNYLAYLIDFQASNIDLRNFSIGNWLSTAQDLGCVKFTSARAYCENVHFVGAGHATPGAVATANDVFLNGAEEITFKNCTFGTDSVLKAAANGEVLLDGTCWRIRFEDCDFISYSATAGKVAVKSTDNTSFSGVMSFRGCQFLNWNPNGITAVDDVFGGTASTSGQWSVTPDCTSVGYTGWGGSVYVAGAAAAASAGGQIATTE